MQQADEGTTLAPPLRGSKRLLGDDTITARVVLHGLTGPNDGGKLYPDPYTLMRATYRGGWVLEPGQSLSFSLARGTYTVHFITGLGARFEVAGRSYVVGPGDRYQAIPVSIPREGRVTLRCLSGAINLDRMTRNDD